MIALSSRALGIRNGTLSELCDRAQELGFQALGVAANEYVAGAGKTRASAATVRAKVVSLRAGAHERRTGPNASSEELGALDKTRSARARSVVLEHFDLAAAVGCSLVVVEGGSVDGPGLDERLRHAKGLLDRGDSCDELIEEIRRVAAPKREAHLERLCQSLHALAKSRPDFQIALIPASRPHGLLTLSALRDVLFELRGVRVGVWIDVGRVKVAERLGGDPMTAIFPELASKIVGLDAHDTQRLREHLTPGEGEVDWKLVAENTPRAAVRVLDVDPAAPAALLAARRVAEQLLLR